MRSPGCGASDIRTKCTLEVMGTRIDGRRRAALRLRLGIALLFVLSLLLCITQCLSPTEVRLVIATDVPCGQVSDTSITAGTDPMVVERAPPTTVTKDCSGGTPTNHVGDIVLTPGGDRSGPLSILVVMGVDNSATACSPDNKFKGCIVQRRLLHYDPHTPEELPVEMDLDCKDVPCDEFTTCQHGQCVPSNTDCSSDGTCGLSGDGGSNPDAAPDVKSDTTPDSGPDSPGNDANGSDTGGDGDSTVTESGGNDGTAGDGSGDSTTQDSGDAGGDASLNDTGSSDANEAGAPDGPADAPPDVPILDGPPDVPILDGPPDVPIPDGPPDVPIPDGPPDVPILDGPPDVPVLGDGNPCGDPWSMGGMDGPCD
jgi:hypothetical protein